MMLFLLIERSLLQLLTAIVQEECLYLGGSNAIDIIERLTCDVCCIVDNYKEEGSYKGIPIVGINYLKLNLTKDDIILITPSDSRDIIIQLDRIGISQYLLCDKPWRLDYYYNYPDEDRVDDCVEFYLVDAFEIFHFAPIVLFLRENQINARIVAENSELNTKTMIMFREYWMVYQTVCRMLLKITKNSLINIRKTTRIS